MSDKHMPSPELLRTWARDPTNTLAWGLDAVADEMSQLRAKLLECEDALWDWSGGKAGYFETYGEPRR
jgi:hypothetical protein